MAQQNSIIFLKIIFTIFLAASAHLSHYLAQTFEARARFIIFVLFLICIYDFCFVFVWRGIFYSVVSSGAELLDDAIVANGKIKVIERNFKFVRRAVSVSESREPKTSQPNDFNDRRRQAAAVLSV